jgi:hypothetical protein
MIKQLFFLALIFLSCKISGQVDANNELPLLYNQRLKQIGYEANISINGNISDEDIYHRSIHWFRDEYQNIRKIINYKDTIVNCDTANKTNTAIGLYQVRKPTDGNYRINGRYFHPHRYKRFGSSNYIEVCGEIDIIINNATVKMNFSNFKLPFFGYLPIEAEVLKPGTIKFKRKYRKLRSEIGKTAASMADDLKFWIENYDDIINGVISWRNYNDIEK